MEMEEFELLVESAVKSVPARFKAILEKEGMKVLPRERPSRTAQAEAPGRLLFGMFIGAPYTQKSVFNSALEPARIEIYKEGLERAFADPREMERQGRVTVIHEIGHFFGFSEEELREHLEG